MRAQRLYRRKSEKNSVAVHTAIKNSRGRIDDASNIPEIIYLGRFRSTFIITICVCVFFFVFYLDRRGKIPRAKFHDGPNIVDGTGIINIIGARLLF